MTRIFVKKWIKYHVYEQDQLTQKELLTKYNLSIKFQVNELTAYDNNLQHMQDNYLNQQQEQEQQRIMLITQEQWKLNNW